MFTKTDSKRTIAIRSGLGPSQECRPAGIPEAGRAWAQLSYQGQGRVRHPVVIQCHVMPASCLFVSMLEQFARECRKMPWSVPGV